LKRFQMDSIFSLGAITVALSEIAPRPSTRTTAPAAATPVSEPGPSTAASAAAAPAYTDTEIEQIIRQLNWDQELVSMEDLQKARAEASEAYTAFCRCSAAALVLCSMIRLCL
jgi:hypothetical protein